LFPKKDILRKLHNNPTNKDAIYLCLFAIIITLQPFFLQSGINVSESSLYLPGINAVLNGDVPYRDFFQLRGPLELFIPSIMMLVFGVKVSVLSAYFYVGTVLTLIIGILIAKQILKTKYLFYLFALVFVARTFPRVVFADWGGARYAFGLLSVLFAIRYLKEKKLSKILLSGVFTSLGLLTSIEIGICSLVGVLSALVFGLCCGSIEKQKALKAFVFYISGIACAVLPFVIYLLATNSMSFYVESMAVVVTRLEKVIDLRAHSNLPRTFVDVVTTMFMPASKNFRHITPAYLYIFILAYLVRQIWVKKTSEVDISIVCVGVYGLVLYSSSFRNIWGAQFEMALQPEKILLFFLVERAYLLFIEKKNAIVYRSKKNLSLYAIYFLFIALFMSSVCYSIMRYEKRFVAYKIAKSFVMGKNIEELKPLSGQEARYINLQRAGKIKASIVQASELESVTNFILENTEEDESVLIYPEGGIYYFLFDRPFLSRFPVATFSWFKDTWHAEFMHSLRKSPPKYAILPKSLDVLSYRDYFAFSDNIIKYNETMDFIKGEYELEGSTPESLIYKLK